MGGRPFFSRSSVATPDARIEPATFHRQGATHDAPSWTVEWGGRRIEARWTIEAPPVIAYGPFAPGAEFFTILFFTVESALEIDGRVLPGRPYPRDIWEKSVGGHRSSSLIALNESLIEPRDRSRGTS